MHAMIQPDVLICTASDVMGLARLPGVLKAAGCHVTFMGPAGVLAGKSRYIDRTCRVPNGPAASATVLERHLLERRSPYHLIIIGDDHLLRELFSQRHAQWLREWFPVDPTQTAFDSIVSKAVFGSMAQTAGLPVPLFHICRTFADAENAAHRLGFPLVLKQDCSSAGLGVRIVQYPADLLPAYEKLATDEALLAQQFVSGRVGSTEVLFNRGRPVCWSSSYSVACLPTETGPSCVREITLHPDVEALLAATGAMTGFHGFGGIDWIHEAGSDCLTLLEFNARPTPGYHFGSRSGVDFSRCLTAMFNGTGHVQRPVLPDKRHRLIYMFPQDVYLAVHNKDLRRFLQWLPSGPRTGDVPFDDTRVLCTLLLRICIKIAKDARDACSRCIQKIKTRRCACSV